MSRLFTLPDDETTYNADEWADAWKEFLAPTCKILDAYPVGFSPREGATFSYSLPSGLRDQIHLKIHVIRKINEYVHGREINATDNPG